MSATPPTSVRAAYIAALVIALLIGCCALYSGFGIAANLVMQRQAGEIAAGAPLVDALHEMQRKLMVVAVVLLVLQLGVSGALAVGGSLGLSGRAVGRTVTLAALAAFGVVTLLEVGGAMWTYSLMLDAIGGEAGGGRIGGSEAALLSGVGMIPSMCWAIFKLCVGATAALALLGTEARKHYALVGDAEGPLGPRG